MYSTGRSLVSSDRRRVVYVRESSDSVEARCVYTPEWHLHKYIRRYGVSTWLFRSSCIFMPYYFLHLFGFKPMVFVNNLTGRQSISQACRSGLECKMYPTSLQLSFTDSPSDGISDSTHALE